MIIKSKGAFTIIELLIVLSIVALLLSIALLNYLTANKASTKVICCSNLRQIEAAVDQWATDYAIEAGAVPSEPQEGQIYEYLDGGIPQCPSKGVYSFQGVGTFPQVICSRQESEGHGLDEEL